MVAVGDVHVAGDQGVIHVGRKARGRLGLVLLLRLRRVAQHVPAHREVLGPLLRGAVRHLVDAPLATALRDRLAAALRLEVRRDEQGLPTPVRVTVPVNFEP